jgi:hypothetical protein
MDIMTYEKIERNMGENYLEKERKSVTIIITTI